MAAAAAAAPSRRLQLWTWWIASPFQRTWMRLAVQAGLCTLLILCIFSAPAVWELHSFDPVLANPVLVLVISVLGLLFTVNTGLPAFKIGLELVWGALLGGGATMAISYTIYGINGGSHQPGVLKAAMTLLFGCPVLALSTASRFRWPQHMALAAIMINLSVAVGLAVTYQVHANLYKFVLYWWWFIGLAFLFLVSVATLVLPLPTGWAVRKQLARALRQEGKVVEAIVELMAAGGPASSSRSGWNGRRYGGGSPADGGKGGGDIDALGGAVVAGGTLFPDFLTLEQGADSWSAATSGKWPAAASPEERSVMGAALARLWRRSSVRLGRSLSRVAQPFRSGQSDVDREAAALGTHPDMYAAVEPIYVMSGPTAASMAAAHAHMCFTHFEIDLYRPTHIFPLLPFRRLLLLARTLLSAAMMMVYPLQSGRAQLSAPREHAAHLRAVGSQVKRCCQGLAAVLRDNAPVAPAFEELRQLEVAFWQLQQGVGAAAAAAAHAHASGTEAAVEAAVEQLLARSGPGGGPGGDAAEAAAMHGLGAVRWPVSSADLSGRGSSQDSLSLHLSLSMLFTCCTRVRSMYLLLPQLVGRDQKGAEEAMAAHFATAHDWNRVLRARTSGEPACGSPRGADEVFRRSQLQWGTAGQPAAGAPQLRSSRSLAVLERLERPTVQVAERLPAQRQTRLARGPVHRTFAAAEWATGFNRNQLSLGLQTAVSFAAVMFLIFIPSVNAALSHRSVWAVFIIVVVHEPLLGSVIWKCCLRFGGTVVAGLLGLGALYFALLCNGLSFENHPPKFIAMTAALTLLTMPLAAGTAKYGLQNAYFWIVSCLIMYTVALPGYAHDAPMPVLALWRLACTAIGLAVELVAALVVFPVTARSAAHAVVAAALRDMASVADSAFRSVLEGAAYTAEGGSGSREGSGRHAAAAATAPWAPQERGAGQQQANGGPPITPPEQQAEQPVKQQPVQQEQQHSSPPPPPLQQAQGQQHPQPHHAIPLSAGGWHGNSVVTGAVLSRVHQPMMEAYVRTTQFRALLVPLRVEWHPFKRPARFPTRPGRRAQRLCRRLLNQLTTFALTMDAHHTQSVPLLEPHAAELQGLIAQLSEALRALGAMVAGDVTLESAAQTVVSLEQHAQHLLLRVLLSGPPQGVSAVDATQGLAFLAMLFNVTSVLRLLCLALGESFCAGDTEGQAAAARLLRDDAAWAADASRMRLAAELVSEALITTEDEVPAPEPTAAAGQGS